MFLGTAGSADRLSCFKVYNKAFPLQQRHWLNIFRECCILSRLQEERYVQIQHSIHRITKSELFLLAAARTRLLVSQVFQDQMF